ncbi:MAG: flagellar hook-basal body complex protein FliE [Gammaproteobacteria bacterium]|nr:flagellar hook-basal body complex protein FliE [Gammaproteobacteria bacterium]
MNNINMNKSLLEMQRMAAQAHMQPTQTNKLAPDEGSPQSFTELLKTAVNNVNEAQQESGKLKKSFEMGDPNVDLPQVMMASQKAGLAFKGMLEVRNQLLQAYKDVMSMPV